MRSGLCKLIGVREKPGGREKANRGRKRERKRWRKGREKKKKRRCIRPVRLRVCANIKLAGVAIFKGHFTIHQITKKQVVLWVFLATAWVGAGAPRSNPAPALRTPILVRKLMKSVVLGV